MGSTNNRGKRDGAKNARSVGGRRRRDLALRSALEALEPRRLLTTYMVTNLLDDGSTGSLRWAVGQANANAGADTIAFNTAYPSGPGLHTITLASALPTITGPTTIDGTTQPGYAGAPLINVNANSTGGDVLFLNGSAANGSVIKGIKISGFTANGVRLNNVDSAVLQNLDLSDPAGNYSQSAVVVENGSDNVSITGVNASGTFNGITVTSSTNPTIQNNTLDSSGSANAAIYLNGVPALAVGAVSGNNYAGSGIGLRVENGMSGLVIGDASVAAAHVRIEDNTSGMRSVTSRAIHLFNVDDATIDNVDVGYAVATRLGEGIRAESGTDRLTVKNSNAANRATGVYHAGGADLTLTNNSFANDAQSLDLRGLTKGTQPAALVASGNNFAGSTNALRLETLTGANAGLTIGTAPGSNVLVDNAADGLRSVTGTVVFLSNVDNATISGLNLAYTGSSRLGTAISTEAGSDNLIVQNVTASNRTNGISVVGGVEVAVLNNVLTNTGIALYIDGATDGADAGSAPVAVSGNNVGNSGEGMRLWNMSGMSIGTTGSEAVVVNNAADGFKTVTSTALWFRALPALAVAGLDLSWTGTTSRLGTGIYSDQSVGNGLSIQNVTVNNRTAGINLVVGGNNAVVSNNNLSNSGTALQLTGGGQDATVNNNNLSNSGTGLYLDGFTDSATDGDTVPVVAAGNVVTNDGYGFQLFNLAGLTIGTSGTGLVVAPGDGLTTVTNIPLWLRNLPGSTVDGLNLSWTGSSARTGTAGIYSDQNIGANFTVKNVTSTNRLTGLYLDGGGTDLTLTNNNLSNNTTGLSLNSFGDGAADADSVPVVGSGNVVTNSTNGLQLWNMFGLFVGTSGTGLIVDNVADGLRTVSSFALYLRNLPGSTVDGLDVSWAGPGARVGYGIYSDSTMGANFKVQNLVATNRAGGIQLDGGGQDLTLTNNNLSNNALALSLNSFGDTAADADSVPVVGSSNVVTGSAEGMRLWNMFGLYVSTSGTGLIVNNAADGLRTVNGNALYLRNLPGSTIDGLDVSYSGVNRSGNGIYSDSTLGATLTISNVSATNRSGGIILAGGGQDLTLTNNNLSNTAQALYLDSYYDGADADGVPVVASGNQFANSGEAIRIWNTLNQFIGTSGTGFIINNATAGLGTSLGGSPFNTAAIYLRNFDNGTISGLDLSYTGAGSRTGRGIFSDSTSDNVTVTGVAVANRSEGIRFDGGSAVNINNSTASNNVIGIGTYGASDTTLVNNNRIEGNTTGLAAQAGGVQVNAENNYWGSAAGPGAGGNNGFTGNADVTPFLATIPGGAPALPTDPGPPIDTGTDPVLVTTNADVADGDTSSRTALGANPGADGAISLREAILAANNTAGADTIGFKIGTGAKTIRLNSALPAITGAVTIDGQTQPGYVGTPLVTIDAFGRGGANILDVTNVTANLAALKITGWAGNAVRLSNADNSSVTNLDLSNPHSTYTSETGVSVESGSDNVVLQGITVATFVGSYGVSVTSSADPTIQNLSLIGGFQNLTAALYLDTVTGLVANAVSGNSFANSGTALRLWNMTGLTIGDSAGAQIVLPDGTSGLGTSGTALYLRNIDNSTIDGLDLAWTGAGTRVGTGINSDSGSDNLTIQNTTATNRADGITVAGGTDLTLANNNLSNDTRALTLDGVVDGADVGAGPVSATGTTVAGSATGMTLWNMTGLTVGTAGTDVVVNNATAGFKTVGGTPLYLRNLDNSTISGLDLSWTGGPTRSGTAINSETGSDALTIQNVTATNRSNGIIAFSGTELALANNNLSNTAQPLYVDGYIDGADVGTAPMTAVGTVVAGSTNGLQLWNMLNLSIGTAGTNVVVDSAADGFGTVSSTALYLRNLDNSSVANLNLSWTGGASRSGTGLYTDGSMDNFSATNVTANNRSLGVQLTGGGTDLVVSGGNVANSSYGLYLDGFTDGADAGNAPVTVSGVTFGNNGSAFDGNSAALTLFNMTNLLVGPAGTNNVIVADADGLKTSVMNALWVRNLPNSTIDGMDLSYTGATTRTGRGVYADSSVGANFSVRNVTATNRSTGVALVSGGTDLTLANLNLSDNGNALYLDSFSDTGSDADTVPVVASGLTVTGSTNGMQLFNMNGLFVGTAGTGIIVSNATTGMQSVTSFPLYLRNLPNSTIDGLDLAYSGALRSGSGIYADSNLSINFKVQNVTATNRSTGFNLFGGGQDLTLTNNNLSNNGTALYLDNFSDGGDVDTVAVVGSGNNLAGATVGMQLFNSSNLVVATSGTGLIVNNATDGLQTATTYAMWLRNLPFSTIDGVDVSYSGGARAGVGLYSDQNLSLNFKVQNVTATNRGGGIQFLSGGQDLTLLNNNLSNNAQALYLSQFTDGGDADLAPFSGSGNAFHNSLNGIYLNTMTPASLVIGDTNVAGANFVVRDADGLRTVSRFAVSADDVDNVTIDGLDVSYRGTTRSGTGIRARTFSDNWTIRNVTAVNRQTGLEYNPDTTPTSPTYLVTVQNSNFLNNDVGLSIVQYNAGGSVTNSRIEGNTTGLSYGTWGGPSPAPAVLNATGNYWGPANGGAPGGGNNGVSNSPAGSVNTTGSVSSVPVALHRDYGDAPIAFGFSTRLVGFGARHVATGPMLGAARDAEADASPTTLVDSDDATGGPDDEDGVTLGYMVPGQNASASVVVSNAAGGAKLDAWVDFNRDGDWDDAGERIANSLSVVNGTNAITFAVPAGALIGPNYARFRVSTLGGLSPDGQAVDGEVEDTAGGPIWVDDDWAALTPGTLIPDADPVAPGQQNAVVGLSAFATVNGGIGAAYPGGLVVVNAGNYAAEAVVVNKAALTLAFQEAASTVGSLDDTVADATVRLDGVTLTAGGGNANTRVDSAVTGTGSLAKAGSGTMTLAGANLYTGNTTVSAGTLALAGATNNNVAASPTVTVAAGASLDVAGLPSTRLDLATGQTLAGTGSVTGGTLNALTGSTVSPGVAGPGLLTTGSVSLQAGSSYAVQLNGTTAGTQYDRLAVGGAVNLVGATLSVTGTVTPAAGQTFTIVDNDGADAVVGTFAGLPQGGVLPNFLGSNQFKATISYTGGTGNDVVLTVSAGTPPTVSSYTVNEGAVQRSKVKTLSVTFNGVANLAADAITLERADGSAVPGVTVVVATAVVGGKTVATVTFTGAGLVHNGSLADGRYKLRVNASKVTDPDASGTTMAADYTAAFFRLYGDGDGDAVVGSVDVLNGRPMLNKSTGQAGYRPELDPDEATAFTTAEYNALRARQGMVV